MNLHRLSVVRQTVVVMLLALSFPASAAVVLPNWSMYDIFVDEYVYVGGAYSDLSETSGSSGLPLAGGLDITKNWSGSSWTKVTTESYISFNNLNGIYSAHIAPFSESQGATGSGQYGYGQSEIKFTGSFIAGENDEYLLVDYSLLGKIQVIGNSSKSYAQLDSYITVNGNTFHWLNDDDFLYTDRDDNGNLISDGNMGVWKLSLDPYQTYVIELDLLGYLSSDSTSSATVLADATFGFSILPKAMSVPEPGVAPLLALGLLVMVSVLRRQRPV